MLKRLLLLCVICSGCADNSTHSGDTQSADTRPNVILFLTDDQGWGDVGFNGNSTISTPHIDNIAQQGVSLDRFYVNPVCSPTRAALLTGRQPLKTGVFSVTRGGEKMRADEVTLAEALKAEHYATGMFGKWHNGAQYPHDPNGQGFDDYLGFVDGHQTLYFDAELLRNGEPVKTEGYIADVTTDAAIEFIRNNHKKPFFAYVPFNTPHGPFEVPQQYFSKYKNKGLSDLDAAIYGMVENIDDNIGRVMDTLDELALTDNTIVIFLSDNGPAFPHGNRRYNGGMKGSKGRVDEGGVRVPFFIHWPEHIEGGRTVTSQAQHMDIFPTLMSLLNIDAPPVNPLDGDDISPLLLDESADKTWPNRTIYTNHFRNTQREDQQAVAPNPGSIRTQQWLGVYDYEGEWYLYDLVADPEQKHNLAATHPDTLETLKSDYMQWHGSLISEPVQPIAIEIGHQERPNVTLSAHEAYIAGDAVDYAFKAGWAHDWAVVKGNGQAEMKWPLKNVAEGNYKVIMEYATPSGDTTLHGSISFGRQAITLNQQLAAYSASEIPGNRLYYTDEAPELVWQTVDLGTVQLDAREGPLRLNPQLSGENAELHIKSVRFERDKKYIRN